MQTRKSRSRGAAYRSDYEHSHVASKKAPRQEVVVKQEPREGHKAMASGGNIGRKRNFAQYKRG